ncbi:hypothetical protein [Oceanobacillus bengalensis]|uniref:DUF1189 domain-containing protein n=1 Tax=Oceanobacillus bengalensis TaxID=1435466 RepID=A0A494YZR6_9BACI|nr:hypothetical protein [Oceanobacillus bengalensis]RKQ15215.1 hypothetical protein D8M05_10810 [Oceanobacillus bengalensis]
MIVWNIFVNSIKLPNKQAMFKLNRVGLDHAVFYNFLLLFIVSLPSLIKRLTDTNAIGADMNVIFTLIYFFMFYYLPITIIVFVILSGIAYIGKIIARLTKRKLHYSLLWKISSFTTTIPFLLYTILALVFPVNDIYLLFSFIYSIALIIKMIHHYPIRRKNR